MSRVREISDLVLVLVLRGRTRQRGVWDALFVWYVPSPIEMRRTRARGILRTMMRNGWRDWWVNPEQQEDGYSTSDAQKGR